MNVMKFSIYNEVTNGFGEPIAVEKIDSFDIVPVFDVTGFKNYRCSYHLEEDDILRLVKLYKDYHKGDEKIYEMTESGHRSLVEIKTPSIAIYLPIDNENRLISIEDKYEELFK